MTTDSQTKAIPMKKTAPACDITPVDPRDLLGEAELKTWVATLKALGHPVRLRMVDLIHHQQGDDICVCEFEHHFDLKQPTISHHLKILRDAGLIQSRQDGSWVRHSIEPDTFVRVQELLGTFSGMGELV